MTATFRAELIFGSNAEEAAAAAVKASDTMSKAQINAQSKIAATIARGDPLKALQVQQFKELQSVYELEKKKTISVRDAEQARKTLTEKFSKERIAIEQQTAAQVVSISKSGVSANGSLEKSAKSLKEQMAQVGSAVTQVGSAFGGMGGQAVSAGSAIVGSFGAGGLVGIALAATGVAVTVVAGEWQKLQGQINASAAAARAASNDFRVAANKGLEDAKAKLGQLTGGVGSGSEREGALAAGGAETARARLAKLEAQLAADAGRGDLVAERNRLNVATGGGRSVNADPNDVARLGELRAKLADGGAIGDTLRESIQQEIADLKASLPALDEQALVWREIAERERQADAAKSESKLGRAALSAEGKADRDRFEAASRLQSDREFAALPEMRAAMGASSDEEKIAAFQARFKADTGKLDAAESARTSADINLRKTAAGVAATDTSKIVSEFQDAATPAAILGFGKLGVDAANSFLDNFSDALKSGKPADIFKGLLGMLPAALSLFGPAGAAGGGILSGIGSLLGFRDGGAIPQGRNGLGVSEDATLVGMHRREVIFNEQAAASFPGGFPQAVRVGMGLEALPSGGGVQIHQHVHQSFAPTETRAAYQAHLAPAMAMTFEDRQSPLVRSSLARSVAEPRSI